MLYVVLGMVQSHASYDAIVNCDPHEEEQIYEIDLQLCHVHCHSTDDETVRGYA